ncbi:MAG TPA: helix-turn-helix transcriptional regulator [Povalibacter sp.]|nr:helix-turn-helix transcriptional regulator [Povalibacter sp.]
MNETKRMLETLKRCLRARGMTYSSLGKALGLSESSVKRLFADESFTLTRLERVCSVIDMSVADLSRMASGAREAQTQQPYSLTLEQERTLASNASLLACFYLLLNGRTVEETERRLDLNSRAMRSLLSRLTAARLIEIDAKRNVRLHAKLPIAWRPDGPVRRLYERQVRAEFLQGPFSAPSEALTFHSAELSPASVRILLRKLERLAADFADLAALDVHVPSRDKTSVAVLLACRPWVFSMFSAYRARGAA